MAAPTETYIDPADGAAAGNDHGGAAFVDGAFANATLTLTKVGAFPAATCQAGDKLYLDDNGSGEVTPGLYTISARTDDNNVVLTADIRSGAPDPTDVRCDQHTGAVGLPWATVQHALDFTTRDAVNGDRFNVKAGTDDVLAAALSFATYGTPTLVAPWICQGYTAAAGDGGIGGISGGGNFSIVGGAALDYLGFIDMHLHNSGAAAVIDIDDSCTLIGCEVDNTSGAGILVDFDGVVINCYVHNCGGYGVDAREGSVVAFNTLENGANDFSYAIYGSGAAIFFNVIDIDGTTRGIYGWGSSTICFNSIYSNAGTEDGIFNSGANNSGVILGNIVEGFSGVGGVGINFAEARVYGYSAFYNNTANLSKGDTILDLSANDQALTASPFIDAANDDFRVNSSVRGLAYLMDNYPSLSVRSYLDIGALQRAERPGPTLRGRNTLLRM